MFVSVSSLHAVIKPVTVSLRDVKEVVHRAERGQQLKVTQINHPTQAFIKFYIESAENVQKMPTFSA